MKISKKRMNVANRLSVKSRALPHLLGFGRGQRALCLTAEDEEGRKWVFQFRIRQGKYKKPELSTGWFDFVRHKKLKTGVEVHFFKEEDKTTGVMRYMIKAMTEVTLFGAVIGYVPCADQAVR